ncbi:apolipoprotein B-100-like [Myxocyprinus asiaticus]|uniref:apolipoprotein B-100-like n=1 Tax=Myxocyprinus asiaticus TaxID=70543 RepID=UPI0022239E37|nr:apolipoprotein B-100-like [Myxocyprinus asiaticus]
MWDNKLWVLLLLSTVALSKAQDEGAPCLMAKRYKSFHKYEYFYETESLNAWNGAVNGPKASCKVEIEVPGTCSYIVHTTDCTLSEVIDVDDNGNPVFGPADGTENFKVAMEKHLLKFTVDGDNEIKLFPEQDELINILNIKRGIISALAVPVLEEEKNKDMPTIYGLCKTDYIVNTREDIATDITLNRDLSRCEKFRPVKDHTSPLALITGMHYPLAHLIRSTQTCNYKFDNEKHHMTSGTCTEKHVLVPFSYKKESGVTNIGKQTLNLLGVMEYNNRVFDHNVANMKPLHVDSSVDMSPIQDKHVALDVLREFAHLSKTTDGHKRAHLAHKLVSVIRKMNAETLIAAVPEALEISRSLTYQVLLQCGTPECNSAIMQIFRTFDKSSVEIDAAVYAMGMMPQPSRILVKEMLEMAKFKPSKPIYYAVSNAVRRLYEAEGVTQEIQAVVDYALEQMGDCTGDQEHIYLSLRVIGNMGAAMGAASPVLKSAVIECINQPAASPEVQQAAIQVFRQTSVPEEGRKVLLHVILDRAAPIQKRVAAYLILMKNPESAELAQLTTALHAEENLQAKSFFISYITNVLSSTSPETLELRQKILEAFQGNEIGTVMDPTKFSRNYKIGSLEGNMIFESAKELPKEVMLDMTLNAFGFDVDMVEIGMEGKGLEPTIEALFGPSGFFPDTVMKTIFYAVDKMPSQVSEVLKNVLPILGNERKKRQVSQNIIREISHNVNKLIRDLKAQDAPEAMVYLRLLGAELGYLKTKDMEDMAHSAGKMIDNLLKMIPTDFIKSLLSSPDNELFLHYIFMDNEFFLPTGPGFPLRVALSGTFTPGIKGGLSFNPDTSEFTFMPSAGIEFVTEVGAHFPDYVHSGLEMHTNIYHESGLKAKVSMSNNNAKLTIPAPQSPIKLFSVANSLVSVVGAKYITIPAKGKLIDAEKCIPLLPGLKSCTSLQYSDAIYSDAAPYLFAIELHPTAEVTEYTTTINYSYEDKIDKVTVGVKAEGTSFETTATVKFNRQKYTVSADLQIPDYELEARLRIGDVDPLMQLNNKGKGTHSIQIDLVNKNIPLVSVVSFAKIEAMKDAMLEIVLLIPSLQVDSKVTTNLKCAKGLTLELESDLKLPEISSVQKLILKYDGEKIEAEVKSDVSSEIQNIIPNTDDFKTMINGLLEHQIDQTEMNIHDILSKSVETSNAYLKLYTADIPYVKNLRVPALPVVSLPERLFLNVEAAAKYHFGQHYYTISLPLPLGGKSTRDLNFPSALSTPSLNVPQLGLDVASIGIPLPEIFIPESMSLFVPTLGMAEVSGKLSSNFYNLEAAVSAGRDAVAHPSYSAKVEVTGTSSVELLSVKFEGSALAEVTPGDSLKANVKTAVNHKLFDASISVVEEVKIADKVSVISNSKFEVTSSVGVQISLEHTGQVGANSEEISGDANLEGSFKAGQVHGSGALVQTVSLFPFRPEVKVDSSLKIDSTPLRAQNTIVANFANGELSILSNTAAFEDLLTNIAEMTFKESQLALKSDTKTLSFGLKIQNTAEARAGLGAVSIKIETSADRPEDHIHSLITGTLDVNGLAIQSDASAKLVGHTAAHKARLTLNKDGLATSGTTSLQSPLSFENTFSGALDASKVSLNFDTKGGFSGIAIENANSLSASVSSVEFNSKAKTTVVEGTSYSHEISLQVESYTVILKFINNLKSLHATLINEAELKAEPYKADLTGSVKLATNDVDLRQTYEISYADLIATAKCSTSGSIIGTHMSHNTEVEIAGLAVRFNNDARFNSKIFRFDTTIRSTAVPFKFNFDAIANADGDINLYGKQSAQIYSKLLLKAEPLAIAHSHECRVSTTHNLDNGVTIETNLDNKADTLLTPSEQMATVTVKSKVNNHAINQEISAYNTPERLGLEVSGMVLTSLFNTANSDNQDFSVSGFLKYDKSSDSHVINLPFIENLPVIIDNIRITLVSMGEALRNYINREEIASKIQNLPKHVSDFVNELNISERAVQFIRDLVALSHDYTINLHNLEASLINLRAAIEKLITDMANRLNEVVEIGKEMVVKGILSDAIVDRLRKELNAFNEEYDISALISTIIEAIEDVIRKIDMTQLQDSSFAFLHDLEQQYAFKAKLNQVTAKLKQEVANFDKAKFVEDVKNFVSSINIQGYKTHLIAQIPTEDINKVVDAIKQLFTELDIIGHFNSFHRNVRAVIVKYEVDKKITGVLEKVVELIKQYKIDESVQVLAHNFKYIQISISQSLDDAIIYLKTKDVKQVIEHLNEQLDFAIKSVRSFDYNAFVDEANQKIQMCNIKLNSLIESLEISQKLKATSELVNYALSSLSAFLEDLRAVKVADAFKTTKDLINMVALNDIKALAEKLKQGVDGMDLTGGIYQVLQQFSHIYIKVLTVVTDSFNAIEEVVQNVLGDQAIVRELKQIINGVVSALKSDEFEIPSFTFPLTDLVIPTMKISLDKLKETDLPTQIDLPEFTILEFYTVPATTIRYEDINQRLLKLINFITIFDIQMFDVDGFFSELTMNYLPEFSAITLPEIILPAISLPAIPKFSAEHMLDIPLLIPEIKFPAIPTALVVPSFGKLYGEVQVSSPIYSVRTSAEFQKASEGHPLFMASISAQGTSANHDILNYNLECTTQISIPEMSHVIVSETLKLTHISLDLDHQASLTLHGFDSQASAKTHLKATTSPFKVDLVNIAHFSMKDGMSFAIETSYNHQLSIPLLSLTSEATLTQKAVARKGATTITITVANEGTGKFALPDFSDEGTHKSDLQFNMDLSTARLTLTGHTDSAVLKMKMTVNADAVVLSHLEFSARVENESPFIKNSLVVASGKAHLGDMKVEVKATHDAELVGAVSGSLSNVVNIMAHPSEVVIDFQNKGNTKITLYESLSAKIDLQNDYAVTLNTDIQHISTVALARFNQYKYSHNFTLVNNKAETGIYAVVNGEANLEFLKVPITIPKMFVPVIDLKIPAIRDISLYDHTGLKHFLINTDQVIDLDAKLVYQKSRFAPIFDLGCIIIPSMGNFISEVSFKSSILNLNANAGIYGEENVVIRVGATTASVFEGLKAKLDGTTRLTTKSGLKLATSLSLQNAHIEGTHESTLTLDIDNYETVLSADTTSKINLPILTVEATHHLSADNKAHPKAVSNLKIKHTFDLPVIKAIGSGDTEHTLKVEAMLFSISIESATKGTTDNTLLDSFIVKGALDNEAIMYTNADGLRFTLKAIGNGSVNHGVLKLEFDINESLALEAAFSRVYAVLNLAFNNEVNIADLNSKGKHTAQAKIDLAPLSSFEADVEIDLSQPSSLGEVSIYDKVVVEVTALKQKVAYTAKMISPVYTTNVATEFDGNAPDFKIDFKASATSPVVLLEYDLHSSLSAVLEHDGPKITAKAVLKHAEVNIDVQNVFTRALSQTVNVDVTSPSFTDVNFRYSARRDGISVSVSTPSTGFLGFQLQGRIPSQLQARLHSRYASAPENDADILVIKAATKSNEKFHLQVTYNLQTPNDMILGLHERLPIIFSTITGFAEKYGILSALDCLKNAFVNAITEAYTTASNHAPELSQLSVLFRNVVVQSQKTVQMLLDAAIKYVRETKLRLPGIEEATLPEICKKITSNVASVLEQHIPVITNNLEAYLTHIGESISSVQITLPSGEVITGARIVDDVKSSLRNLLTWTVDLVKHLESFDIKLEKLGQTIQQFVEKSQEFIDNIHSDILDRVALSLNAYYTNVLRAIKSIVERVETFLAVQQKILIEFSDFVRNIVTELTSKFTDHIPSEADIFAKVCDGKLEIMIPFYFSL